MDYSILVIVAVLLSLMLVIVAAAFGINWIIRRDRMPYATKYENIHEMAINEERRLSELRASIRDAEQKQHDVDRLTGQVAVLQEQLEQVRVEHATLDSARREIDEVKEQAAKSAEDLATYNGELAKVAADLELKRKELDELQRSAAELPDLLERLAIAKRQHSEIESQLQGMRDDRANAQKIIEDARIAEMQRTLIDQEIVKIKDDLGELRREVRDVEAAQTELAEVERDLKRARAELSWAHEENSDARSRLEQFKASMQAAEQELLRLGVATKDKEENLRQIEAGSVAVQAAVDKQRRELAKTTESLAEKLGEIGRLEARQARLEAEIEGMHATGDKSIPIEELTADLIKFPTCLETPSILRDTHRPESEAIAEAVKYLSGHGLEYSDRTVKAFHTCLKINDNAQLTVLAGVSGTGKSLLPRRYAEAMGIHFHQIAVEPRWDSPQDLLGFYNYIEKRYRATDLARLLVHMDPYCSLGLEHTQSKDRSDHMALVLLDEMNLARVEYYFSEFLSRLEVRPRYSEAGNILRRKDALIPVDIRMVNLDRALSLFPSHNVLFAGTMNDDESTQALSDKVLDRSNVLQFAAPRDFKKPTLPKTVPSANEEAQSLKSWRQWMRPLGTMTDRDSVDDVIQSLAELMQSFGRPFGHRLQESILAYVSNYPSDPRGQLNFKYALADQIEFRILPKLRGVDIAAHQSRFDSLGVLIRGELDDSPFSDRLASVVDMQLNGSGLFVWPGLTRRKN